MYTYLSFEHDFKLGVLGLVLDLSQMALSTLIKSVLVFPSSLINRIGMKLLLLLLYGVRTILNIVGLDLTQVGMANAVEICGGLKPPLHYGHLLQHSSHGDFIKSPKTRLDNNQLIPVFGNAIPRSQIYCSSVQVPTPITYLPNNMQLIFYPRRFAVIRKAEGLEENILACNRYRYNLISFQFLVLCNV